MVRHVRVESPARLHLGFVDLHAGLGRRYGSLGVALDGLSTIVAAAPGRGLSVAGPDAHRAEAYALATLRALDLAPDISITVEEAIPAHAGLGSGTQLALAVAAAIAAAHGVTRNPRELAGLTGRGKRSGIGIGTFETGGFVVDGGVGEHTVVPPLLARFDFPPAWRVILVCDDAHEGLSGNDESAAFESSAPMSAALAAELCRQALMGVFPALVEHDFDAYCRAIAVIQAAIGDYFGPHQGGRYTSPRVAEAIEYVQAQYGLQGVGQTSWGPTGFIFVHDEHSARRAIEDLEARFTPASAVRFSLHRARNHGAVIKQSASNRVRTRATV